MTAEEGREIAKVEPIPTTLEYLSLAPVRPHDRPDHAQAEAKAALRTALVTAVESIPDPQDLIRGQAHSRVFDADQDCLLLLARRHVHASAGRTVGNMNALRRRSPFPWSPST